MICLQALFFGDFMQTSMAKTVDVCICNTSGANNISTEIVSGKRNLSYNILSYKKPAKRVVVENKLLTLY
jgi:hypothetical protein